MKVRIGISTHNRADILSSAIKSALQQDYPDLEVVVFDDGSTDNTAELQSKFPEVQWLGTKPASSIGYRKARNQLMSECDADLYCSLDDDSWFLEPDAISKGVSHFENNPQLGAIAYDIIDNAYPEQQGEGNPQEVHTFIGCGHLLRLSAVREAGFYADLPGSYGGEEKDLSLRLLDLGYNILRLPGVHVWHDKSIESRGIASQHQSGVGNDLSFALLRCPLPNLLWVLPGKLLSHLSFAIRFALRKEENREPFDREVVKQLGAWGFLFPTLQGCSSFLAGIPANLSSRKAVQQQAWKEYLNRSRKVYGRTPMRAAKTVAITITTRNRKERLLQTLKQFQTLDPQPDEVLICCDGDEEETYHSLCHEYPEYQILQQSPWQGSIPARDTMLHHASSDVVLSLDDDSYPQNEDFIERLLEVINNNPLAAVITFPQNTDEFPETLTQIPAQQGARAQVGSFTNSGAAIRKEIYLNTSGYPHYFQHAYEEPDFTLRCLSQGYTVLLEPTLQIRHLYTRVARNEKRTHRFHARNEVLSALSQCPILLLLPTILYRSTTQLIYSAKRGLSWLLSEPLWWLEALKLCPQAWKHRQAVRIKDYLQWLLLLRSPKLLP